MTSLHSSAAPAEPAAALSAVPAVRFEGVRKTYAIGRDKGRFDAIQSFDLDIREGESVVIVGPSGCGKSTLLRLLVGLDRDFGGRILIDGQAISGIGDACGMVFQEHRLFPWLNVEDNIALGLANEAGLALAERRQRVESLIELVGLQEFRKAYPHQLSGGMAQRVAIARGLVRSPRILLLDEPFGALDALTRRQMQEELLALRERSGITTLLVTHDVEEAVLLADKVIVMTPRPGRIQRIVEVDLPHPRQPLRGTLEFLQVREALLKDLTDHAG